MARSELLRRHVEAADRLKSEVAERDSSLPLRNSIKDKRMFTPRPRSAQSLRPPATPSRPRQNGMILRDYQAPSSG